MMASPGCRICIPGIIQQALMPMKKIRNKLILIFLIVAFLPLVPLAWIVNQLVNHSYQIGVNPQVEAALKNGVDFSLNLYQLRKNHLGTRVEQIRSALSSSGNGDRERLHRLLPEDDEEWHYLALQWYNTRGKLLRSVNRGEGVPPISPEQLTKLTREHIERIVLANRAENRFSAVVKFPRRAGSGYLVLTAALPESFLKKSDQTLYVYKLYRTLQLSSISIPRQFLYAFIALSFIILVGTVFLATYFSRKITRSLNELAAGTREIGRGNLDYRIRQHSNDEIGELVKHFNQMAQELKAYQERSIYLERMAAWQEIARRLAHEIKNPLTPIQLTVQEMVDQYSGEDREYAQLLSECHTIISEELENLRRLVHEFSEFGRLPKLQLKEGDIHSLIRDVARLYPHREIRLEFADSVPLVEMDEDRIRRVLINLLENAIQADPENHPIIIRTARTEHEVIIELEDRGVGIAPEVLAKIFQPYFSTRKGGAGLGLAITRRMVEEHGGSISVESEVSKGTRFDVRLPLKHRS